MAQTSVSTGVDGCEFQQCIAQISASIDVFKCEIQRCIAHTSASTGANSFEYRHYIAQICVSTRNLYSIRSHGKRPCNVFSSMLAAI